MIKVGVFFGGVSREREISFAGAKTIAQTINRTLFEPVFILVDGLGKFIKIEEKQLDHHRISSFYPSQESIPEEYDEFSPVYIETLDLEKEKYRNAREQVGTPIPMDNLGEQIDFSLLIVHGTFAEDGMLQGVFEWLQIPYSGCGIFASSFAIDKHLQQVVNDKIRKGKNRPYHMMRKSDWQSCQRADTFEMIKEKVGFPLVVKAPYQGSSIGVSLLREDSLESFVKAVNSALFIKEIEKEEWLALSAPAQKAYVNEMMSLEKGIGLPVVFEDHSLLGGNLGEQIIHSPPSLISKLNDFFAYSDEPAVLTSFESEDMVLFEGFLEGKEFSCGILQDENLQAVALPPTEIITTSNNYDFEAKYLPSGSQKRIPIDVSAEKIKEIQERCKSIFESFKFDVCARIDGFCSSEGDIEIIDINTIPGMSPTSLIFRQAAEIGLSPTNFLTYFVYQSLIARLHTAKRPYFTRKLFKQLQADWDEQKAEQTERIAIFFDGSDLERVRKHYNKTSSEGKHQVMLIYVNENNSLTELPVSFLLKPSPEEIKSNLKGDLHPAIQQTIEGARSITELFTDSFVATPQTKTIEHIVDDVKEILWVIKDDEHSKLKMQLGEVGLKVIE